jgi:hypothetical protein
MKKNQAFLPLDTKGNLDFSGLPFRVKAKGLKKSSQC